MNGTSRVTLGWPTLIVGAFVLIGVGTFRNHLPKPLRSLQADHLHHRKSHRAVLRQTSS
jgi:hypothetical protein